MEKCADKSMPPHFPVPATRAFVRLVPRVFSFHFKNILEKNINKMYHLSIVLRAIRPLFLADVSGNSIRRSFCIKKRPLIKVQII